MAEYSLIPHAELRVGLPADFFGTQDSLPETVSWDLRGLLAYGSSSAAYSGLTLDPTGQYVMQAVQAVWIDADETQWTTSGGTYNHGIDPETGKKFLRQTDPTATFSAVNAYARAAEEGLSCSLFRGGGSTGSPDFYLWLSSGAVSGVQQLRVAFTPGRPVRVQSSLDGGATWATVATANGLGDSDRYLSSRGRRVNVTVIPETDPAWAAALPGALAVSGPPPGQIVVNIGHGDAILTIPAPSFVAGSLKITGTLGQWAVGVAKIRYAVNPSATLPAQTRPNDLPSGAVTHAQGYLFGAGVLTLTVTNPAANSAAATLAISTSGYTDGTGYSTKTVFLSTVDIDYPGSGEAPAASPAYTTYYPTYTRLRKTFNPRTGFVRAHADLLFSNSDLQKVPGLVHLGCRAGSLFLGYLDANTGESIAGPGAVQQVLTGWTGLGTDTGQGWEWIDGIPYFRITLDDKLRVGDADQEICGYQLPYDYQCHYYAVRQQLYRMGIRDEFLTAFPNVGRNQDTSDFTGGPFYYLPGGTTREPLLQPEVGQHLNDFLAVIRKYAAEPSDGQYSPMVIGSDPAGNILYYPIPPGLVQAILNPTNESDVSALTPLTTFGRSMNLDDSGNPMLNEFRRGGVRTSCTLTEVRNEIVLLGIDPNTGDIITAFNVNGALGGSSSAAPNTPGYLGSRRRYYDTSRLYNNTATAAVGLALASVLLNYPTIRTTIPDPYLQPWMGPLDVFSINDYATTGTTADVPFFVETVECVVDKSRQQWDGYSSIGGRLLGEMAV